MKKRERKKRRETSINRVVPLSKGVKGSDKQKVLNADSIL
jgi:hypothetical protein